MQQDQVSGRFPDLCRRHPENLRRKLDVCSVLIFMLFRRPSYDWLIAGLGNPGAEYEKTRHNTGFMTALTCWPRACRCKASKERFKALTAQADFGGQRLFLMKPLTYMNASGIAIEAAAHFYKIPPERVLVLFDDISLPVGNASASAKTARPAATTASSPSSPAWAPTSSRGSRSASAPSRTRTTTWPTGCSPPCRRPSGPTIRTRWSTRRRRRCAS